jgi:hypothetical protein
VTHHRHGRAKTIISVVVGAVSLVATTSGWTNSQAAEGRQSVTRPLPTPAPVSGSSLACEALLKSTMLPASGKLEGDLRPGEDRLAVEIDGSVLRFMTRTSVEVGQATPAEFAILRNSADILSAVLARPESIDTFLLNKRNGFAVWTKSRGSFLSDPQPDTQAHYLRCW